LFVYGLDFGAGGLAPMATWPHTGGVVLAAERERQERLLRMLRSELERRRAAAADGADPADWPAIVVVLDNWAGFFAAFDDLAGMGLRDDLTRVIADGAALGMALLIASDRPGAVPAAVAALIPDKLVLRLADPYDYAGLGIGTRSIPAARPGRAIEATSGLELQLARPNVELVVEGVRVAPVVGTLPEAVALDEVLAAVSSPLSMLASTTSSEWVLPLGLADATLGPAGFVLGDGDHALVAGPARSGKSTLLAAAAAAARATRPEVTISLVALRRSPLRHLGGAAALVTTEAALVALIEQLGGATGTQLVLVDDADGVDDPLGLLAALLARRQPGLHVLAAGSAATLRAAYGHWTAAVRRTRQGVLLRPQLDLDAELLQTVLPRRLPPRLPPGRGLLIRDGEAELFQAARPAVTGLSA
jgi:S-DNA-T family DNA segregation ATPase FtsK/SpoIIIE